MCFANFCVCGLRHVNTNSFQSLNGRHDIVIIYNRPDALYVKCIQRHKFKISVLSGLSYLRVSACVVCDTFKDKPCLKWIAAH